jgi:F0F1-type ATP synthase membrane subunit a
MIILIRGVVAATRRMSLVPRGAQNFVEVVLEQIIPDDRRRDRARGPALTFPLIGTLGLFHPREAT